MSIPLLTHLNGLPNHVQRPTYNPSSLKAGIVHLGLGAFHKSHQAFYTDAALEASGGNWKIVGVSMRDAQIPTQVNAQNGLYTLVVQHANGPTARVIASIDRAMSAATDTAKLLNILCSADTRIVSLTVTEKGYGIDRQSGGVDQTDSVIAHDLKTPDAPCGAIGLMVRALELRRKAGTAPFTVLCCDNLPSNGVVVSKAVLNFAQLRDPTLAHWIGDNVPFPSTMVDRITPAQSAQTLATAAELTGHQDTLAIEAEPFHQWVVEDKFATGRPEWEAAGALFTANVAPFEEMKLRMLNGAHSMLAYGGFLADKKYVRDVMLDDALAKLVARHLHAASSTLAEIPGINLDDYACDLMKRFANPQIAHETNQIASDGSQKLPQRIFEPALVAAKRSMPTRPFAFATALWMHYCGGTHANGQPYPINDPIAATVQAAANQASVEAIVSEFSAVAALIPSELAQNKNWNDELVSILSALKQNGVRATLDEEALLAKE